jgi:hypothetical protein
VDER